ncbi:DUF6895 family protein [Shewanella salipaludis]|uniref:DUF6895 domain-containing protein n=1 Tax=Shewanella salipaludis TaxID=2723052 RepID=A0A972JK02_9GAMM|nr:hypothetical protein [Shewanella salipaludis]NMH66668.1 hypothetical protein [Shewanella salipaludis]
MQKHDFGCQQVARDYLGERISNINQWLDEHVECFTPTVADSPKAIDYRRKAFGEAGLYLYVADKYPAFSGPTLLQQHYWQVLSSPAYLELAHRNPATYGLYAFPVAVAKSLGRSNSKLDQYFESTYQSRHLRSIEMPPFRLLDNLFFARIYDLAKMPYAADDVMALTNIRRLPDLIMADETQAYALTHNIFYLTGMQQGQDFLGLNPEFDRSHLQALEGLFVRYMANNNLDLALELLMCLILTGLCKKWHLQYALELVEKNLLDGCIVPGPGTPDGFELLQESSQGFQTWVKHYHTMLVAGMAFRLAAAHLQDIWQEGSSLQHFAAYGCGQVLRLLHDYNLPLALTVLKTLEQHLPDIKELELEYLLELSIDFIEEQKQADGSIGFYYDEYCTLSAKGKDWQAAKDAIQLPLSQVYRQIDWPKLQSVIA